MSIASSRVTVATTPTLIVAADSDGCRVVLHNQNATAIIIGASGVTTTTGLALQDTHGPIEFVIPPFGELYGIVATGTVVVQVLVFGNR